MIAREHIHSAQAEELDLIALWRVWWRYKFVIAGIAAAFGVVAVVLALLAKPIYRAEAIVTPVRDNELGDVSSLMGQFGGLASLVGVNLSLGESGQEAQAVLESRRLAEEFIKRHVQLPTLFEGSSEEATLWRGVKRFRESVLSMETKERQGLTTIAIDWTDAATAARWANAYVALANELLRGRALEESQRNIDYITGELARTEVVELRQVMYEIIETETKRLMLANGRIEYAFMLVDPAVAPEIRHSPKRTLMVLVGTMIGLIIGATIALVLNTVARHRRANPASAA